MQSLQDKALIELFNQYLLNKPPNETIKQLMTQYLTENKSIVSEYLKKEPIYSVYCRGEYGTQNNSDSTSPLSFIKNFATFDEARQWVIINGKEITDYQYNFSNDECALTIVTINPTNTESYWNNLDIIGALEFPTFAFKKEAYEMLLREHRKLYGMEWVHAAIPKWIYWVKDDGSIFIGCEWEHVVETIKYSGRVNPRYIPYNFDDELINDAAIEFEKFNNVEKLISNEYGIQYS